MSILKLLKSETSLSIFGGGALFVGILLTFYGLFYNIAWGKPFGINQAQIVLILTGGIIVLLSALIFRNYLFLISANALTGFFIVLALDNALLHFPQFFGENTVRFLSPASQANYRLNANKNETSGSYFYDEYIYYYKYRSIDDKNPDSDYGIDEFGYRNPIGYLQNLQSLDVLLVGDSFTEGTNKANIASNLRKILKKNVYSVGIGGQGIFHWRYQFERFMKLSDRGLSPQIVVLNYYEGNDFEDTLRALKYIEAGLTNSAYYPSNPVNDHFVGIDRKLSLFNEIHSIVGKTIWYPLREYITAPPEPEQSSKNPSTTTSNGRDCNILFNANEGIDSRKISHPQINTILDHIKQAVRSIQKEGAIVIFSYIPNTQTVYGQPKISRRNQMHASGFLRTFLSKHGVVFVDPTPKLIEVAADTPLHPCSGDDNHFNELGYYKYSEILADLIGVYLDN